jgi:hypothetical protein
MVITDFEALRDSGGVGSPFPPGRFLQQLDEVEAPEHDAGGFFVGGK